MSDHEYESTPATEAGDVAPAETEAPEPALTAEEVEASEEALEVPEAGEAAEETEPESQAPESGVESAEEALEESEADETAEDEEVEAADEARGESKAGPAAGDDEDLEPVEALGRDESKQALHALLFASDRPISADRLAEALGDIDRDVVVTLLDELAQEIEGQVAPYVLRQIAGGYQFTTKPQFGPYIRRLFQIKKKNRLSKSVLETLAIIAYKQPVTRPAVEAIRGVSVSHAFEILQEKKLIKVAGVAELPGRPKLYRTTDEFLAHFGIDSLKGLPSIEEIREMG